MTEEILWKWKTKKWLLWAALFWLVAATGTVIIAHSGGGKGSERMFVLVFLLMVAIFSAFTDREWKLLARIFWPIGLLAAFFITQMPMTIVSALITDTRPELEYRVNILATFMVMVVSAS